MWCVYMFFYIYICIWESSETRTGFCVAALDGGPQNAGQKPWVQHKGLEKKSQTRWFIIGFPTHLPLHCSAAQGLEATSFARDRSTQNIKKGVSWKKPKALTRNHDSHRCTHIILHHITSSYIILHHLTFAFICLSFAGSKKCRSSYGFTSELAKVFWLILQKIPFWQSHATHTHTHTQHITVTDTRIWSKMMENDGNDGNMMENMMEDDETWWNMMKQDETRPKAQQVPQIPIFVSLEGSTLLAQGRHGPWVHLAWTGNAQNGGWKLVPWLSVSSLQHVAAIFCAYLWEQKIIVLRDGNAYFSIC